MVGQRYPKAVHLPIDDLRELVRSGRASPLDWNDETTLQFELARRNAARMAADYADSGFAAIIEDVVREADMNQFMPYLSDRALRRVLLLPSLAEVKERNRARTNKTFDTSVLEPVAARLYPTLVEGCRPEDGWIVVNSTKLAPEATVDQILATVEK